jgi:hemolysin III
MDDSIRTGLEVAAAVVKPRLRGWLHLATAPLTLAAGVVLVVLSPTATTRLGSAVYAVCSVLLFTVSAIYHRGRWSPRVDAVLRRFDHANIFLFIAGTYTPFSLLLLHGTDRVVMLSVVWGGAVAGVAFRVLWVGAPRWLYTPIYIALGWAAVFFLPQLAEGSQRLGVGLGTVVGARGGRGGGGARSTRSAASSTASSGRTPGRAGSGSTRCSTPARSWRSPPTTSGCRWRRTP